MKKLSMCFIFIILSATLLHAQFNPPQNFYIEHNYICPCNYYHLYWDAPESGTPELVNYNVYRNWELIATLPINYLSYSEVDPPWYQGTPYIYYYITALYENPSGESTPTDTICCGVAVSTDNENVHSSKSILTNHPNPFMGSTTIDFNIKKESYVTLSVYNVKGEIVTTLVNELRSVGDYHVAWNGKDASGEDVSPGIYFCCIETEFTTFSKKLIVLR